VPKLRSSTSDGYLTTGIAYAWHPHRDTWTAALPSQINWWIPVYELHADNAMTFFLQYWDKPVKNSSSGYNYFLWNQQHRGGHVTKYLKDDPRPIPRPQEEIETSPDIRLICPVGGVILFSAAHLHASVPNTSGRTRFSFDFRTVQLDDIAAKRGAANIDSECKGHMLRDYIRPTDLTHVPEEFMALYDDGSEKAGALVYEPAE
jgi:ectoine hydroxylase-related dioxygenase (phytanoyl-CoA dioxygenase family)